MGLNKFLWTLLLFSFGSYANESLCKNEEDIIFQCDTKKGKIISICGEGGKVRYKYGIIKRVELELSSNAIISKQSFSEWNEAMIISF